MWSWKRREAGICAALACQLHISGNFTLNQYKHGISRRYLLLDDEGRAYKAIGRNEFREIAIGEALAMVEAPLKEMGETLDTPYDSAYVRRKEAALREAGIKVLRIRIVPEDMVV
jgi:hypothetical protein